MFVNKLNKSNNTKKLDFTSQIDDHVQKLSKRQLEVDLDQTDVLKRQRLFCESVKFTPLINDLSGTVSFEDMKKMHANETYREHLSSCGLTNDEILFKVKYESGCLTKKNNNSSMRPTDESMQTRLAEINQRIEKHEKFLLNSKAISKDVIYISRHEKDLEATLNNVNSNAKNFNFLLQTGSESLNAHQSSLIDLNDTLLNLKEENNRNEQVEHQQRVEKQVGPLTKQQIFDSKKLIFDKLEFSIPNKNSIDYYTREQLASTRLTLKQIKNLKKFSNYTCGEESNILYVKNLSRSIDEQTFVSLFLAFQDEENKLIKFKLLNGKMKGQGFVRFASVESARKALENVNGFVFKDVDKPVIVQFGKETENKK